MKKLGLLLTLFFASVSFALSQTATLGTYPATSIATASGNATVSPSSAPVGTGKIAVYTAPSFKGLLSANSTTGVVTITNAHPAGSYTVVIKATDVDTDSTKFVLTVGNALCSQGAFVVGTTATSNFPQGVVIADVNNDGRQDFVVGDNSVNTITAQLGNGAGGFSVAGSAEVGLKPQVLVAADFNNDSKVDIATANSGTNTVSVRLGNGTGNFGGTITIPVGNGPTDIITGDFNSDGKSDIATANQNSGTVSIRLGDGAGGFSGGTDITTGANTIALAIADFDKDGRQDFVAITHFNTNVIMYRGDGSGNFTRIAMYYIGGTASDVVTGDFNKDETTDVAVANEITKSIWIATGDGTGKLRNGYTIANTSLVPNSLAVGDFNGDGRQDIAASNISYSTIAIFLNQDNTGFNYSSDIIPLSGAVNSLAVADFNGDGRQDIVASGYYTSNTFILLGGANSVEVIGGAIVIPSGGNNYPFKYDFTDFGNVAGSRVISYTIRNSGSTPLFINSITTEGSDSVNFSIGKRDLPTTVVAANASTTFSVIFKVVDTGTKKAIVRIKSNNCDRPDYFFNIKASGIAPYISIRYGDTMRQVATTNRVVHVPQPAFTPANASATTTPGFRGLLSLNPITGMVSVSNAQPAGTYRIVTRFYNSSQSYSDSFMLVVQPSGCNNGNLIAKGTNLPAFIAPRAIATADFNNDNRPDLAIADSGNGTVQIMLATDTARFTYGGTAYVWNDPRKLAIADINNDGYMDIVTASYTPSIINIHRGDGFGSFLQGGASAMRTRVRPTAIALADLNRDGWTDMVVASDSSVSGYSFYSTLLVYLNSPSGFGQPASIEVGGAIGGIAINDYNSDGYPDIALAGTNRDAIPLRFNNGAGSFGTGTEISSGFVVTDIATGDFNQDGKADLAHVNRYANSLEVKLGTGIGTFPNGFSASPINKPIALYLMDYNGDGSDDWVEVLLYGKYLGTLPGDATSYTLIGRSTISPVVDTGTIALATGDWNADGLLDIATISRVTNRVQMLYGRNNKIAVEGSGISIANNSAMPDSTSGTLFAATYTGDSITHSFLIRNTGSARLYINSITISNRISFTLKGFPQQTALEAGDSLSFSVTFLPKDGGLKEARINISSITCNDASYSFLIRGKAVCTNLSADNVWLGNTANWNTASNWSLGVVPDGCGRAVVNAGVSFMPQISTSASCYSLTLNGGATFTVTGSGRLNITGP